MMFAPRYTVWHCGYLKKGKREMNTEADDWANERQSNTPRTDEAQFMPSEQPPAFNIAQYMVKAGFAQTLERENAALRLDAERYRWLQNAAPEDSDSILKTRTSSDFDAAIDTAMKEERK
jgi:hypothetical protein